MCFGYGSWVLKFFFLIFNFFFFFFGGGGGGPFGHWFVSFLVGGYVYQWVCVFWGWWMGEIFNSREGVSVGLFFYKV